MTGRPLVVVDLDGERALGATLLDTDGARSVPVPGRAAAALNVVVARHPGAHVAWRDQRTSAPLVPVEGWPALLRHDLEVRHAAHLHHHDRIRLSVGAAHFTSPYLLPPPDDRPFGTWVASPVAGVATATALARGGRLSEREPFAAALAVHGYALSQLGVVLWSEPALTGGDTAHVAGMTEVDAALVVRHTLRRRFLPVWLLARAREHHLPLLAALRAATVPPRGAALPSLSSGLPPVRSGRLPEVDVVVPTLGRRDSLARLLDDVAAQRHRPRRVVVVEQVLPGDPDPGPLDVDPLLVVDHLVLDRPGACHARNVGLARTTSPWVALLDDDVRIVPDYLERLLEVAGALSVDAVVAGHDDETAPASPAAPVMWHHFGSGEAIVARTWFERVGGFDRRLDGGYGEDYEWGMRARRAGAAVVRAPGRLLRHEHEAVGGLRRPYPHPWHGAKVAPVPSPTVTLSHRRWETDAMRVGRTVHYWMRSVARDRGRRPVARLRGWRASQRWAEHLRRALPDEEATRLGP